MARPRRLDEPRTVPELEMPAAEAALLAAMEDIRPLIDTDVILRNAVEAARDRLGLARVGIFILDRSRNVVQGTWGTDRSGRVVDQHDLVHELSGTDLLALRRWEVDGAYFTVFRTCGVRHRQGKDHGARCGWTAKTPIRTPRGATAILINGSRTARDAFEEARQMRAAVFCSALGTMLDHPYGQILGSVIRSPSASQKLVASSIEMLEKDPGLAGKQLAAALDTTVSRLASLFKMLTGLSLVEYRHRLRLMRFQTLAHDTTIKLRDAALQAGFGSYAQFHRVFRARVRASPSQYLGPGRARRRTAAPCVPGTVAQRP